MTPEIIALTTSTPTCIHGMRRPSLLTLRPLRPSLQRLVLPPPPPQLPLPLHHHRRNLTSSPPPEHSDIESFQSYAEVNGLSQQTTVYVGTLYEYPPGRPAIFPLHPRPELTSAAASSPPPATDTLYSALSPFWA